MSLHMLTANTNSAFRTLPPTPAAPPKRLILAPYKLKLSSNKSIGRYLTREGAESLTYEEDNPSCLYNLTTSGIITILNHFVLRQWTSLGIREVLGPDQWTSEQREL